jgi:hypothetical protein
MLAYDIASVAILPTAFLVVAFFVFFAASRSERRLRLFGIVLGSWLVALAVLNVLAVLLPLIWPGSEPRYDRWLNES